MLNPEQAQEALKEFLNPHSKERALAEIALLSEPVRSTAYALLGYDDQGKLITDWQLLFPLREKAMTQFAALNDEEHSTVFRVLFPKIAEYVTLAWQLHRRLPYQAGYSRKSFRTSSVSSEVYTARYAWLTRLIAVAMPYEQDITWFATWAPYLCGYQGDILGVLLAAAIDANNSESDAVFNIVLESARGEHPIGTMGRHVTRALLVASRLDGWEFIEKLLLAAQRQEGLRQSILETIDEAHPIAFRRMLRLIGEHDLVRFSATIRAVDTWFGFQWDVMSARFAQDALTQVACFLEDPSEQARAIAHGTPQEAYLALWSIAFEDADAAIAPASQLLLAPDAERRFVGCYLLALLGLPAAKQALVPVMEDPDLRIAMAAFSVVTQSGHGGMFDSELFEAFEHLIARMPAKAKTFEPLVWSWQTITVNREIVADALVRCLGARSSKELIPYLAQMSSYGRSSAAGLLGLTKGDDPEIRNALLGLVGDIASHVRNKALEALAKSMLSPQEALRMEALLTRKANDLRRGILPMLLKQSDTEVLPSAERLLAAKEPMQRLAGVEMLQQLVKSNRLASEARTVAVAYREKAVKKSETEDNMLDALLDVKRHEPTLADGLGLFDPRECSPRIAPQASQEQAFSTPASLACIKSLEALIHEHREQPVQVGHGREEQLLGNVQWGFPSPNPTVAIEDDLPNLPLRDIWVQWWAGRAPELRDSDGLELWRALAAILAKTHHYSYYSAPSPQWLKDTSSLLFGDIKDFNLKYSNLVQILLGWMLRLDPPTRSLDFLLDAAETTLTLAPDDPEWRSNASFLTWLNLVRRHQSLHPAVWQDAHKLRLWNVIHWMDQPTVKMSRMRPPMPELLHAYTLGAATDADLLDQLIGPRSTHRYGQQGFDDLMQLTCRQRNPLLEQTPKLSELVDLCRDRIIEIELQRGILPTAASGPALSLRSVRGSETLVKLLRAFGNEPFARGYSYGWHTEEGVNRSSVFSRLIRASFPAEIDTPQEFAALVQAAKISEKRLVELAVYAPQWAKFVEHTLGWPELSEAIWWLHAHTKDTQWTVDQQIRDLWTAEASERTPLSAQSLLDGAVDVTWFGRVHSALGQDRWALVDEAAKYASGGGGHKRAQLFADAMLGRAAKSDLVIRVKEKRHQDALRALGLVPLDADKETDALDRYKIVQEFVRGSRQFGAQRQVSEKLAANIALENLARTCGFADPARLEWAMEAKAVADLAEGSISATAGDVTVSLSINEWGAPNLAVTKNGKTLKAIPASVKKSEGIAELQRRKTEIERQASRMRQSLEAAMCRGDVFTGSELRTLMGHPVLSPMLRSLVLIGDGLTGYPTDGGQTLETHDGGHLSVTSDAQVRIAHPYDLLQTGEWHAWQRECFLRERIQPFKQIFRELYVLTESECTVGYASRRYAGHQVNQKQAMALLGTRGWVGHPDEGDVRRTFHDAGLTASLTFDYGYTTPAEVEGLTIDHVIFTKRGEWKAMDIALVPPRVFSEAMRDLDLVVSVAHQGGVDPEASASTVEMRSALVREACALLKLDNVRLQKSHVLIDGKLGTYSVHLGSALVHRQPGGHLCIVPVHSQHRGRLFLPFADNDPRTAEVVSKVLLLAKDTQIKDPTILEQIYAK